MDMKRNIRSGEEQNKDNFDKDNLYEVNRYADAAFPVGAYKVTREGIMPEGRGYKDLHWHEELQFTYVVSGELKIRIDGKDYLVKEQEAVFINRNLLHITTDLTEDGKYISLNFPDKILGFFPGSRMEQDYVFPYTRGYMLPAVILKRQCEWQIKILENLMEILSLLEYKTGHRERENERTKDQETEYQIAVKLVSMWLVFIRNMQSEVVKPTRSYIRKQERIQSMLTYIHENYMNEIHLKDIADAANVSIGECCRCFQNMVRTTPNQYLIDYRVEKSKELLIGTQMSVTEIAYAVGFNDSSYFIQCFKKDEGVTPGEYGKC